MNKHTRIHEFYPTNSRSRIRISFVEVIKSPLNFVNTSLLDIP
jgi:hypothetical protein